MSLERVAAIERALELDDPPQPARQASDPRTLAEVLASCCLATWAPDTLATRSEQVRELSPLLAQVGDLQVEFVARLRETNTAIELGEFERGDAALERLRAIAEQTRQPS